MVSFYGRLFTYRARKNILPLENFLSEALCDLLNRMPPLIAFQFVDELLLAKAGRRLWAQWCASKLAKPLLWSTQYRIEVNGHRYWLDILLETADGRKLLVIENKISSTVRSHGNVQTLEKRSDSDEERRAAIVQEEADELRDQIQTYGHWLASVCDP